MQLNEKVVLEIATQNPINGEYFYTDLTLPATKAEIEDAYHKMHVEPDSNAWMDISVINCPYLPELADTMLDCPRLDELNFYAQRLTELNEDELFAMNGLFNLRKDKGDYENGVGMQELINMTYGLHDIMVIHGIASDKKLGEVVIEGDMDEEIINTPESKLDLLDRVKVGQKHREDNKGIFFQGKYIETCAYKNPVVYDGTTLPEPMKPEYQEGVFHILISKEPKSDEESFEFEKTAKWIRLPMTEAEVKNTLNSMGEKSMEDLVYYNMKSPIDQINEEVFDSMEHFWALNEIAKEYMSLNRKQKIVFKALVEKYEPNSMDEVAICLNSVDEHDIAEYIDSCDLYAKEYLKYHLPTNFDSAFLDGINLNNLGERLTKRLGAEFTEYGLLSGKDHGIMDMVPYLMPEQKEEQQEEISMGGMLM